MSSEQISLTQTKPSVSNGIDKVHGCSKSDIGLKREENQDSFGVIEHAHFKLYAVADGMGGVKGGAVASGIAIQTIKDTFAQDGNADDTQLVDALVKANGLVFQEALSKPGLTGMGTTFVGLLFQGEKLYVANIGDSRAYLIRDGTVTQLTEDHTLVMELLRSGTISAEQAENHPVSHMLTRSLGPSPDVEVDCRMVEDGYKEGDQYVLCSDGLYNLVANYEIAEVLGSHSLENAVAVLVDLANERGGTDNITVIAVQVGEKTVESVASETEAVHEMTATREAIASESMIGSINGHSTEEVVEVEEDSQSEKVAQEQTTTDLNSAEKRQEAQEASSVQNVAAPEGETISSEAPKVSATKPPHSDADSGAQVGEYTNQSFESSPESKVERTVERSPLGYLILIVAVLVVGLGGALVLSSREDTQLAATKESDETQPQEDLRESSAQVIANIIKPQNSQAPLLVDPNNSPPPVAKSIEEGEAQVQQSQAPLLIDNSKEPAIDAQAQAAKSAAQQAANLSSEQRSRIERRIASLKARLVDLDSKIDSFDKPVSGNVGKMLKEAQDRIEKHRQLLDEVKKSIDLATRKLAIWYQRRKQLKETDPINLAATVALVSEKVSVKYDTFKEVSAQYIREAESLNFNPSDQRQRDKVSDLIALRKKRMAELGEEIHGAIDEEIAKADQHVAEFALQRDRVEQSLQRALRDVEYAKVVMGADKVAKQRMRDELNREHETAQAEVEGLQQLIPSDGVHLFDSSLQSSLQSDTGVE